MPLLNPSPSTQALLNSAGINSLATQYGSKSTDEQNKNAQAITMAVQNNLASE